MVKLKRKINLTKEQKKIKRMRIKIDMKNNGAFIIHESCLFMERRG
jgi:hypothetical protein